MRFFPFKIASIEKDQLVAFVAETEVGWHGEAVSEVHPIAIIKRGPPVGRFRSANKGIGKAAALHGIGRLLDAGQFQNGGSEVGIIDQPIIA